MLYSQDCPNDNLIVEEPRWDWLTEEQRLRFGNGVGPSWFPEWLRIAITGYASFYFVSASWKHHDFGYAKGHRVDHRREYDGKFLDAMKLDASRLGIAKRTTAYLISYAFYAAVRIGGRGSFFHCHRYRSLDEVIAASRLEMREGMTVLPDGLPPDKSS